MRRGVPLFVIVVLLAVVGVSVVWDVLADRAVLGEVRLPNGHLTPVQQGQLDLFQQRIGALLTVCTVIIGGAGALFIHFREQASERSSARQWWAFSAIVVAALSMYFGYLAYEAAIWMLRSEFFNLDTFVVKGPALSQVWSAAIAVILAAICMLLP